jgi:two-component system, NtrC family, sensor kinase
MSQADSSAQRTFDLENFSLDDVDVASERIRRAGENAGSMEEAAQEVVEYLFRNLLDLRTGGPGCALVRMYKTHAYGGLDPDLQAFAGSITGEPLSDDTRCFTLLGTFGEQPEWCSRVTSQGHRAIPLASEATVERLPMINRLFQQLGIEIGVVINPRGHNVLELSQRAYEVFHVENAVGSEHIPAQDEFVLPYAVRSAVGFGGVLYSGDLYALILFSKVAISPIVARRLKILALPLRVPLLRFTHRVFAASRPEPRRRSDA